MIFMSGFVSPFVMCDMHGIRSSMKRSEKPAKAGITINTCELIVVPPVSAKSNHASSFCLEFRSNKVLEG